MPCGNQRQGASHRSHGCSVRREGDSRAARGFSDQKWVGSVRNLPGGPENEGCGLPDDRSSGWSKGGSDRSDPLHFYPRSKLMITRHLVAWLAAFSSTSAPLASRCARLFSMSTSLSRGCAPVSPVSRGTTSSASPRFSPSAWTDVKQEGDRAGPLPRSFVGRASYTIDVNRGATVGGSVLVGRDGDFLGQYRRNSHVSAAFKYSF